MIFDGLSLMIEGIVLGAVEIGAFGTGEPSSQWCADGRRTEARCEALGSSGQWALSKHRSSCDIQWQSVFTKSKKLEDLEADIVVMQETKIRQRDLKDEMVLIPGWDVFFSFPTFNNTEEGVTGILMAPKSKVRFRNLPEDQRIGGYLSRSQLNFPAVVVIGVHCPTQLNESRDDFRIAFLMAVDTRVRNLMALGKRVLLASDLNIIREEIDTSDPENQLTNHTMTGAEYVSTPIRRVFGQRDEDRESPVMWDICCAFHPGRMDMFIWWEQLLDARLSNLGSRVDYILCSLDCYPWFSGSNIQENTWGSDHCPVYATFKSQVELDGAMVDVREVFSNGMFNNGVRCREWTHEDLLPLSRRLLPEFDRRQHIDNMPGMSQPRSITKPRSKALRSAPSGKARISQPPARQESSSSSICTENPSTTTEITQHSSTKPSSKRGMKSGGIGCRHAKRTALVTTSESTAGKKQEQRSLDGLLMPQPPYVRRANHEGRAFQVPTAASMERGGLTPASRSILGSPARVWQSDSHTGSFGEPSGGTNPIPTPAPYCEHGEPCISMIVKMKKRNCGESFYLCGKPIAPSRVAERDTKWQCGTFIWSSDWTGRKGY
ncbi:DNA lyase-like protein [Amylocarpus encephaloides]|uniref:DNA-(apurinic or apyrimidinic site) endonuclease 2 n=1 Tax=Amylocarpus encephaloides TaxID=45428 RepID=A0A9P7YAY1_9HELO|nr:DNA lyase-like protein [Amylocarpus encephaloides]